MADHNNLPRSMTSFIGRNRELAEISTLLEDPNCHLLTLVGPGGIGKTRLALEIAPHVRDHFEDGVYFVPLQALQEAVNIVMAIVDALPLQLQDDENPRQRLLDYLREKHLLLVLDNFEHLLDGVDILIDILNATEHVKLMVTSRERLNLQTEHVWLVVGLDVPEDTADKLETYSAVQLFLERTHRVHPDFSFNAQRDPVIRLCRLVDGVPLALELAASWTRVMSCEAITREIQRNIDILVSSQRDVPEQHQSMRAVFDQSWNLLTNDEQAAFPKLSVFRGRFTADAAAKVAGTSLQSLASFIDKSLVQRDENRYYNLHELLRQYCEEKLEVAGKTEAAFDRHCEYYARFMHEHEADLKGPRQIEALNEIEADFENVQAAWQRAVQAHNHMQVNAAVESLFLFCTLRSRFQDHSILFGQAVAVFAPRGHNNAPATWGRILARSYRFLPFNSTELPPEAITNIQTALQIAQSRGNQPETAFCLHLLGILTLSESGAKALALLEESLQHYIALGEVFYRAYLLQGIGECYRRLKQVEQYIVKERECLELCRTHGLQSPMGVALSVLGMQETYRYGNFIEGERYVREAVELYRSMKSPGETIRILRWLSTIVFVRGNFDEARRLVEECRAVAKDLHDPAFGGPSSAILGMTFNVQGHYRRGEALGRESLQSNTGYPGMIFVAWSLGCAYCGLGNLQAAAKHLQLALQYGHNTVLQLGLTALCVPIAACIHAHTGNSERSVELLGLAFAHPNSPTGWLEKWPLIAELRADLEAELGGEVYAAAWERGMALDLEQLGGQLLREFGTDSKAVSVQANQSLLEPLSKRELEVLALIAEDLTNREIADRLYISISTVKKHVNHIYGKLDVKDRIEAIDYATTLGLIS